MTREEALVKVRGYLTDLIPSEDYDEVEEIMSALEQQPKWIPVSERLPELNQNVIVTYNKEDDIRVDISYYDKHGFWIGNGLAWMPLPEPYKVESEDKLDGDPVDIDKAVEHYEGTLEVLKDIDLEVDE